MLREVTNVEELRAIVGQPNAAAANKIEASLSDARDLGPGTLAQLAKAIKPDMSDEQLQAYYREDNLRKILY